MYSKEYLKGTLKTLILSLLSESGDMYGYELTQTVKQRSDNNIELTEGALYPALHKLEANEYVESYTKKIEGRNRKYYKLTNKGTIEAEKQKAGWAKFSNMMDAILNPLNYA
jgi:DNA-binding PadR family transcriptional regulator